MINDVTWLYYVTSQGEIIRPTTTRKAKNMATYTCDYRSPPSGLGTITTTNKHILVQSSDEQIEVKDGIYDKIIPLSASFDDFSSLHEETVELLISYGVTSVYDSEYNADRPVSLEEWAESRR